MLSKFDFINIPKIDTCRHLNSGMSYFDFTDWSDFLIPDYTDPRTRFAGSETDLELRSEIIDYTETRLSSSDDLFQLFYTSISDAISENIKSLNGTINVDFVSKCKNPTDFLDVVKKLSDKTSEHLEFHPFLGIHSDKENNLPLAMMLLDSGLFEGIELYGSTYAENPEKFIGIFNMAHKMSIKSRICCLGFRTLKTQMEIFEILQNLKPTHLMNPNIAINNDDLRIFENGKITREVIDLGRETNLQIEFSPAPILSGRKGEQKARVIREFAENDIPFTFCTEDVLFLGKSISAFAADLCNSGVFTKDEISKLIAFS